MTVKQAAGDIAIIGMSCRFPGAANSEQYWANLRSGVSSILRLTDAELLAAGVSPEDLADPTYVKAAPVLADIDKFDARFFGVSPRDAAVMDPAHRLFLEVAWEAVEHSGNTALPAEGKVGVFATSGAPLYWMLNVRSQRGLLQEMGEFLVRHTGNDMNFLATRVSYEFDLRGPSINVQTACSSALVALHSARLSLLGGECDLALAGGATVLIPQVQGYHYKEGEILSPDGCCRPFDAKSAGTVFGSGAGCLVLKRLSDALDNGDNVLAVIKGSAVNNDGSGKVGYLAPGVDGQADVISAALRDAAVPAESISYVEAHGTGTLVGDPIELTALAQAFGANTQKKQFCAIGSVKSNIGHLGEAAATAALIKVIAALQHRELPPSLGYETPNPAFDFANSAFFVNAQLRPWSGPTPLRCGVTALGAGGTNCHVILEEAPRALPGEGERALQLFVLSAKSQAALERQSHNLAATFDSATAPNLADAAYTLALGRRAWPQRRACVARDAAEAAALLRGTDAKRLVTARASERAPGVVFTFPGGGAQYSRMGLELYETEEVYRRALDACLTLINSTLGDKLEDLLFAPPERAAEASQALQRPSRSLPALFATEYALAKLFQSWGVRPVACIGHSLGEYAAACLAGVFTLEDALRLVMSRGRLFETVAPGGMLAVSLAESRARAFLVEGLSIAAVNAPELCVVSGSRALLEVLERTLATAGVDFTRIHIDVAAHSALLEPILPEFRRICGQIRFSPPQLPFVSNLTGTWISDAQATSPDYWVQHLRGTVQFAACAETVLSAGERVFLELGPGRTLTTLVQAQATRALGAANSLRHPEELASDAEYALRALGKIWTWGADVDWTAFYDGQLRNRVVLPAYPFERTAFWIEPSHASPATRVASEEKRPDLDSWFYTRAWIPAARDLRSADAATTWLIFLDEFGIGERLLTELPGKVVTVRAGKALTRVAEAAWEIDPDASEHYGELLETLESHDLRPDQVVYLWSLGSERARATSSAQAEKAQFYWLTFLTRAVGSALDAATLTVVTNHFASAGDEATEPLKALALGPVLVGAHEFPGLKTRLLDVALPTALGQRFGRAGALVAGLTKKLAERADRRGATQAQRLRLVQELAAELQARSSEQLVLLRDRRRWTQQLLPLELAASASAQHCVKDGDTILITGGLGGIGLEVAAHLAAQARVRLILLTRQAFPKADTWQELASNGAARANQAQRLLEIQARGADVQIVVGDVAEHGSLTQALAEARSRFGALSGVIHAAGVMDDEPMQARDTSAMARVLAAKVRGTLNLDALIEEPLEFFILFSSVASLLGLPGQVDYSAANAFLDAFALERARRAPGTTLAINWNAWRDVGMVEKTLRPTAQQETGDACAHPALGRKVATHGTTTFVNSFSVAEHWLLSEHRIRDSFALLPGTGLLELLHAAFSEVVATPSTTQAPIELQQVTFVAPFQVAADERSELRIVVDSAGEISLTSAAGATLHVTAQARRLGEPTPPALDLTTLRKRCQAGEERPARGFLVQDFVDFGPRWGNIRSIQWGDGEALVECHLPEPFSDDLHGYALHPALLDMATGAAQRLIPGFSQKTDFYVPFGYERVRVYGRVPALIFSHVRCLTGSGPELAYFDVDVVDETGSVLVEFRRFTMKKVDARAAIAAPASSKQAQVSADATADARGLSAQRKLALETVLRQAITPPEGLQAFDRVVRQKQLSQVIVSSVDVLTWRARLDREAAPATTDAAATSALLFERPETSADYVEPSGSVEATLAQIWSQLLGLHAVGAVDDFFALGGNSLVAVRVFARIKKEFQLSLPISTLYEAPTLRGLAQLLKTLGAKDASDAQSPVATWVSHAELVGKFPRAGSELAPLGAAARATPLQAWAWQERGLPAAPGVSARKPTWLILLDDAGVGLELCRRARARGEHVIRVYAGDAYHKLNDSEYSVSPEQGREGFDRLFTELKHAKRWPDHVVLLWPLTLEEKFRPGSNFFHSTQERGLQTVVALAQAVADSNVLEPLTLTLVTNGATSVMGEALPYPSKATAFGPVRALPFELPFIQSRAIDIALSRPQATSDGEAAPEAASSALQLEAEISSAAADSDVAYRGAYRYVRTKRALDVLGSGREPLNPSFACLLTLGGSELGLQLAAALAALGVKKLLLVVSGGQDEPSAFDVSAVELTRAQADLVATLRAQGVSCLVCRAAISNLEQMQALKARCEQHWGPVRVAFHAATEPLELPLQLHTPEHAEHVLAPSLQGQRVLERLFGAELELLVLCSAAPTRTSPALGACAQAAVAFYAASAQSSHGRAVPAGPKRTLAITFEPAAADEPASGVSASSQTNQAEPTPATRDLAELLKLALSSDSPHVSISTGAPFRTADAAPAEPVLQGGQQQPVAAAGSSAQPATTDAAELELHELWSALLATSSADATDLRVAGFGVLDIARLMTHVRASYGLNVSVATLCAAPSLEATLQHLRAAKSNDVAAPERFKHIVAIHPQGGVRSAETRQRLPLFIVAGMFGNVLNLRHLGQLLGGAREIYGLQAQGLYGDEAPHQSLEEMARAYLVEIRRVQAHGPYALGGFSGGGLTAFEMARQLTAAGESVALLVLLDTPVSKREPLTLHDRAMVQWLRLNAQGLGYFGTWAKNRARWELKQLKRRFEHVDHEYTPTHFKHDAIGAAFVQAAENYVLTPSPQHITLFRPALDRSYRVGSERWLDRDRQPVRADNGWSQYAAAIDVHEVPGDHDSMVLEPSVRVLAERLKACLEAADTRLP